MPKHATYVPIGEIVARSRKSAVVHVTFAGIAVALATPLPFFPLPFCLQRCRHRGSFMLAHLMCIQGCRKQMISTGPLATHPCKRTEARHHASGAAFLVQGAFLPKVYSSAVRDGYEIHTLDYSPTDPGTCLGVFLNAFLYLPQIAP